MNEPSRLAFAAARLRYERDRLRGRWRLATGRCPSCPKRRRGPHKFGCHQPGPLPSRRELATTWVEQTNGGINDERHRRAR